MAILKNTGYWLKKLYVLVRKDLELPYASVQAGHAVAQFCLNQENHGWGNGTLIYLGIKDEDKLLQWESKLSYNNVRYETFIEPDLGDQKTAIAVVSEGKEFKKLNLLKSENTS